MPIPYPILPGTRVDSRANVPARAPDWLIVGTTTRTDVLVHLGEPDGAAPDASWLSYGSASSRGGAGVAVTGLAVDTMFAGYVGHEWVEYRRLVVRFDPDGRVSAVEPLEKVCAESPQAGRVAGAEGSWTSQTTVPCVDIRGGDIQEAQAPMTTVARIDGVQWLYRPRGSQPCAHPEHLEQVWKPSRGSMEITKDALLLRLPAQQRERRATVQQPDATWTVPFAEIREVRPPSSSAWTFRLEHATMVVEKTDGFCIYIIVGSGLQGGGATARAARELQQAMQQMTPLTQAQSRN